MMKNYTIVYLLIIFSYAFTQAQVVNVESLRRVNDTSKWSGYANLALNLTKNKNTIHTISNSIHTQYLYKNTLLLFINKIDFKSANTKTLVDKGTQHIRYNYRFIPSRIAWEVFLQSQYDQISAINFRALLGTGPRYKLTTSDAYRFFVGCLTMYEYEEVNELEKKRYHRDLRNSSYISFSVFPKKNISLVSTTYFQPLYHRFTDYRISNDTALAIHAFKNLAFSINITYLFDALPALNVPKEQYKITNGITYTFN